jgi:hypothetical protein
LNCGGRPSESETEPLKHIGPGLLTALALPLLLALIHRSAWKGNSAKSICRIVHRISSLAEESPSEANPRKGTNHNVFWWWIKIP